MLEQLSAPVRAVPPQAQLIEMARGHQVSSMLRVAAQLKLADFLSGGPRTAEELAQSTATHAPSLYRLSRTVCLCVVLGSCCGPGCLALCARRFFRLRVICLAGRSAICFIRCRRAR